MKSHRATAFADTAPLDGRRYRKPQTMLLLGERDSCCGGPSRSWIETVPLRITVTRKKDGFIRGSKTTVLEHRDGQFRY